MRSNGVTVSKIMVWTLTLLGFSTSSTHCTGLFAPFTLINTKTNKMIRLPNVIPLSEVGSSLSILANVHNETPVAKVLFWFDDNFVRTEKDAVWALNGNNAQQIYPYSPLQQLGNHTVRAVAIGFMNEKLGELTHSFQVTAGLTPPPVPATSPVFIPSPVVVPQPTPTPSATEPTTESPPVTVKIMGELQKWHKVTLEFSGPFLNETGTTVNPFMDYRLDVTFRLASTGQIRTVPGYFAADGNAAETSASAGRKWHCHFAPDATGVWTYRAAFWTGTNVSVMGGGTPTSFHGATGNFSIAPSDKKGRDHRGTGRLQYVYDHHLKFADGGWFMKAGVDR